MHLVRQKLTLRGKTFLCHTWCAQNVAVDWTYNIDEASCKACLLALGPIPTEKERRAAIREWNKTHREYYED